MTNTADFLYTFLYGFSISFSFILAIGAQNAFVLKQGIHRQHVFVVCLTCAFSDTILIITGVGGYQKIATLLPSIDLWVRYLGAFFLIGYGLKNFYNAIYQRRILDHESKKYQTNLFADQQNHTSTNDDEKRNKTTTTPFSNQSRFVAIATALVFTWLNPHVYLDTVVLIGTVSTKFEENIIGYTVGAISASWIFFFSLGYGARVLSPLFKNSVSWKILDVIVGVIMWIVAWQIIPF